MTKRKLTAAIMDEWRKHDAGQGIPYIKWAELAASVTTEDEFNATWGKGYEMGRLSGWQLAVDEHSGLVAAVQALIDGQSLRDYEFGDDRHIQLTLTLESALNNLMSVLSKEE